VGQDEWGEFYCRDLERALVRSNPANRIPGPTGQCVVLITPDADRTMNTFLGVSGRLGPERLEAAVIADSEYLYLEGYLVSSDSGFAACRRAQELARQHRTLVSLTLSDPSMVELFRDRFGELVAGGVDLLFCNEEEARAFTGQPDRHRAAQELARRLRAGCVTCGPDGALVFEEGRLAAVPGVPARAVDTTGAGDLFAGGVLFGLTHGFALEQAARLGAYAAAQVVARYGPRLDRPLKDEISRILSTAT
jgi:sugar/nucleoside kinase (ribokinase family)